MRLTAPDGTAQEVEVVADTGNPCALVISPARMAGLKHRAAPDVQSNFGLLEGGWLHLAMPDLGLDQDVAGFASDAVARDVQASHLDFEGLAGLPLLRLVEYGGDANEFWLRAVPRAP